MAPICGLLAWTALVLAAGSDCARILMYPHPFVASHMRQHYRLARQLIERGHHVTILLWPAMNNTSAERNPPPPAARVEQFAATRHEWVGEQMDAINWKPHDRYLDLFVFMAKGPELAVRPCASLARNRTLMALLRAANFSLGVVDPMSQPCSWALMDELRLPYMVVQPCLPLYHHGAAARAPTPFAYVPSIIDGANDRMGLLERCKNALDHGILDTSFYWWLMEPVMRAISGWTDTTNRPLLSVFQTSAVIEYARPLSHTFVYSPMGLLERTRQPISDELTPFYADPLSNGTIILSLTTMGGKQAMSSEMKQAFQQTFARFPEYRIIWRTESVSANDTCQPHVHLTPWFNQTNVLGDHRTKLLITHGGMSSLLEALRHAVPTIGIPMGYDNYANVERLRSKGIGLSVFKWQLTADRLEQTMRRVLNNRSMSARAQKLSEMLADEATLLDNPALWWTEHAARRRHSLAFYSPKGEHSAALVYFCLDLLGVVALTLLLTALS